MQTGGATALESHPGTMSGTMYSWSRSAADLLDVLLQAVGL